MVKQSFAGFDLEDKAEKNCSEVPRSSSGGGHVETGLRISILGNRKIRDESQQTFVTMGSNEDVVGA